MTKPPENHDITPLQVERQSGGFGGGAPGGMRTGFWGWTVKEDSAIRLYVAALERPPDADTADTLRAVARLLDRSYVAVRHRAHELGVCDEGSCSWCGDTGVVREVRTRARRVR